MPTWYLVFDSSAIAGLKPANEGVFILKDKRPDLLFYDHQKALKHAKKLAGESPGKLVQVFTSTEAIESQVAPIIHKLYNGNGELVPR